jgi:hypothetical protein
VDLTAKISRRFENKEECSFPNTLLRTLPNTNEKDGMCAISILQLIGNFVSVPLASIFLDRVIKKTRIVTNLDFMNAGMELLSIMSNTTHVIFHGALVSFKEFIVESKFSIFNGFPCWKLDKSTFQRISLSSTYPAKYICVHFLRIHQLGHEYIQRQTIRASFDGINN